MFVLLIIALMRIMQDQGMGLDQTKTITPAKPGVITWQLYFWAPRVLSWTGTIWAGLKLLVVDAIHDRLSSRVANDT